MGCGRFWVQKDVVCSPKDQGGFGFRKMYDFNQALMMKIGQGLISQTNSFWARVLRGKYGCGNGMVPIVGRRNRESLI